MRTRAGAATASAVAAAFVAFAGVPGIAGGATVLGAWYFLPATYAFALGHVALVALFSTADFAAVLVVEAGLLALLVLGAPASERDRPSAVTLAGWLLLGGGLAWASRTRELDLSLAAVTLAGATILASYGLHRYQLVALGQVGEIRE